MLYFNYVYVLLYFNDVVFVTVLEFFTSRIYKS
jgi:hypothetical protein